MEETIAVIERDGKEVEITGSMKSGEPLGDALDPEKYMDQIVQSLSKSCLSGDEQNEVFTQIRKSAWFQKLSDDRWDRAQLPRNEKYLAVVKSNFAGKRIAWREDGPGGKDWRLEDKLLSDYKVLDDIEMLVLDRWKPPAWAMPWHLTEDNLALLAGVVDKLRERYRDLMLERVKDSQVLGRQLGDAQRLRRQGATDDDILSVLPNPEYFEMGNYLATSIEIAEICARLTLRFITDYIQKIQAMSPPEQVVCPECGRLFASKRKGHRFCRESCAQREKARKAYRRKKKAGTKRL